MKKTPFFLIWLALFSLSGFARSQDTLSPTPGAAEDSLEVEKLKLQIEQLKLENQKLELQKKIIQMETTPGTSNSVPAPMGTSNVNTTPVPTLSPTPDKEGKQIAKDMAEKAKALADQNPNDEHQFVLDLSNGVFWYKGVHYYMNDFKDLCDDQKWKKSQKFLKYDLNGDSSYRYQYKNIYLDRYTMDRRGVFNFEAPKGDDGFIFTTPEGVTNFSRFGAFKNRFETAYFTFDREDKKDGFRILRFKHSEGFLGFDDVLEFWFDNKDNFALLKWGMLDRK